MDYYVLILFKKEEIEKYCYFYEDIAKQYLWNLQCNLVSKKFKVKIQYLKEYQNGNKMA